MQAPLPAGNAPPPAAPIDQVLLPSSQLFEARLKAHDVVQEHLKQIGTIAGATLALTITFLKDVIGAAAQKLACTWLIGLSWTCLGLSIVAAVLSIAVLVNNLDSPRTGNYEAFQAGGTRKTQLPVLVSFGAFAAGMFCLALFGARNYDALIDFQKRPYRVLSAADAVAQVQKYIGPSAAILNVEKVELISALPDSSPKVPTWRVQLNMRASAETAEVPQTFAKKSPKKKTSAARTTASKPKPRIVTLDYFIDATTGDVRSIKGVPRDESAAK